MVHGGGHQGRSWATPFKSTPKTLNFYLAKSSCIIISASTFRHLIVQLCCYDGAHENVESCEKRAAKVTVGPNCSKAFLQCCNLADQLRNETSHTPAILARLGGMWKSSYSMCSSVKGFQAEFVLPWEVFLNFV